MQNMTMKTVGSKLTIEVDLSQDLGPSASGKTRLIASSQGNQAVPGAPDVKIGLNLYRPNR